MAGIYINPGNEGFKEIVRGRYIDKTGLISIVNSRLNTPDKLLCVSRPRRFGKTFASKMLCAYYDCSCDSHELFDDLDISDSGDYSSFLNKYNVICFDVTSFISIAKIKKLPLDAVPGLIADSIRNELCEMHPELSAEDSLTDCILDCVDGYGNDQGGKYIFIIDEWDALIREAKDQPHVQELYLDLLREWFKNISFTSKAVAGVYMTGILPIKKDGSQSAISDFNEFTILDPGVLSQFTGFTENEVSDLCGIYDVEYEDIKAWYDGYYLEGVGSVYNPYSVMSALNNGKVRSYWKKTSAADSLETYVSMDFEGLQEDVLRLIAGENLEVYTEGFNNDIDNFASKDDVLTLMIHLGYLSYDPDTSRVHIPNEEVRLEFKDLLRRKDSGRRSRMFELIEESDRLYMDTIGGNEERVAAAIEKIRNSNYAPTFYNNEQALRYVIKFAYISCIDRYMKVEELPSGKGIADVVYIPKNMTADPAIVVELKWDKSGGAAIEQIEKKNYPAVLSGYSGDIVLVGIEYDSKSKRHSCKIRLTEIQEL